MEQEGIICMRELAVPQQYQEKTARLLGMRYLSGGCQVESYVAFPAGQTEAAPLVVFNRGGNRDFASLKPEAVCRFAAKGFVAAGSQYRGNAGGTGREEFGGAEVEDVLKLADLCLQMPEVIPGAYYMAGHSRGGMMTYLCCARDQRIRAAAVGAGLADCVSMYETREQSMKDVFHELVGGSPQELPEAYAARSAVCFADRIMAPVLICQGLQDWRVAPEQALAMAEQLKRYGKEYRLITYPDADHSLKGTSYLEDVVTWFQEHPLQKK